MCSLLSVKVREFLRNCQGRELSFNINSPYSSVVERQSCKLKVCSSILHEGIQSTFRIHVFLWNCQGRELTFNINCLYSSVVERQSCKRKVCSSILHEGRHIFKQSTFRHCPYSSVVVL